MEDVAALMDRYPRLTRRPGVLLAILMRGRGRVQTYARLQSEYDMVIGGRSSPESIRATVRCIRRQTDLSVTTMRSFGYRLDA